MNHSGREDRGERAEHPSGAGVRAGAEPDDGFGTSTGSGLATAAEARIVAALGATPEVRFALLFGSRAAGRARADSDWDVAMFLDDALTTAQRADVRARLIAALEPRERVDLVLLNDAPPLLAHRALQGRVLLMRDRSAWVRFFVRSLSAVGDEEPWRELHARARRRRLEEGRFGRP